jgi:hypothetical protein
MENCFTIFKVIDHNRQLMVERKAQTIDLGDLIETTTLSVQRAIEARGLKKWPWGPITIGIIMQPPVNETVVRQAALEAKG